MIEIIIENWGKTDDLGIHQSNSIHLLNHLINNNFFSPVVLNKLLELLTVYTNALPHYLQQHLPNKDLIIQILRKLLEHPGSCQDFEAVAYFMNSRGLLNELLETLPELLTIPAFQEFFEDQIEIMEEPQDPGFHPGQMMKPKKSKKKSNSKKKSVYIL